MGAPLLERLEAGGVGLLLLAHVPVGEEDTGKEVEGERKRREGKARKQKGRNSRKERRRDSWGFPASSAFSEASCQPQLWELLCPHFA